MDRTAVSVLLHVCCGPCAAGSVPVWKARSERVVGFFHNPNIHPFLEHQRRLEGAREVAGRLDIPLVVDAAYDPQAWFSSVAEGEGPRCRRCIAARLMRAAAEAVAQGCEAFSTTLSISPWQDHPAIKFEGIRAGELHGVEFVYEDQRSQYRESRRLSREMGIYRQKYCGCLMSEWERFRENG